MAKAIYVADDEQNIREILKAFLEDAGYEVITFPNGEELIEMFFEKAPDMVILDVMMPGKDGLTICNELRKVSKVPIIILTAKDTEFDYVRGMTAGSDDYIVKPFRPTMLLMKIKSIFRRIDMEREVQSQINGLRVSGTERTAWYEGENLKLSGTEFVLVSYFVQNYGRAVSREELLKKVWGFETCVESRVVDETVRRLRNKMNSAGCTIKIETVWGHGYRMIEQSERKKDEKN